MSKTMTLVLYVDTDHGRLRVGTFRAKRQSLRWVAQQVFEQYPKLRGQKCYVARRVRIAGSPGGWADWDLVPLEQEAR